MKVKQMVLSALLIFSASTIFAAEPFVASVKEDGKWGAIDREGQVIIPISYDKIGVTLNKGSAKEKDLHTPDGQHWIEVQEGGKKGFYDRDGKVIIPVSYKDRSYWINGAIAVKVDGKMIFYTEDGNRVGNSYDEATHFKENMAVVKVNGKYGYLSRDGREIAPIYQEAKDFNEGIAVVKKDNLWGIIDTKGNTVLPPTYKAVGSVFSEGLMAVQNNQDLWGFVNKEGKKIVPPKYVDVNPFFSEGYTAVRVVKDDKKIWGFIKTDGSFSIEPQFDAVHTNFSEGLAGVKTKDGNAYIKPDGSVAFMANYDYLHSFKDGLAEIYEDVVTGHGKIYSGFGGYPIPQTYYSLRLSYVDTTGKLIADPIENTLSPINQYGAIIEHKERYGFINRNGIFIAHLEYRKLVEVEEKAVLIAKNEEEKYGLLSMKEDKTILPFSYDEIKYVGDGIFACKQNELYRLVNAEGTILTPGIYSEVLTPGSGIIPVQGKALWKLLDMDGKEIKSFDSSVTMITPYKENRAAYQKNGKWGLMDEKGNPITAPIYKELEIL